MLEPPHVSPPSVVAIFRLCFSASLTLMVLLFLRDLEQKLSCDQLAHGPTRTQTTYRVARFAGGPATTQSKLSWKACLGNTERTAIKKEKGREG